MIRLSPDSLPIQLIAGFPSQTSDLFNVFALLALANLGYAQSRICLYITSLT